jgi:hypothetical protein
MTKTERSKKVVPLPRENMVLVIPQPSRKAQELASLKQIDIIAFSQAAEDGFIRLVWQLCKETSGQVAAREVYSEAAYELGISVETAKRYLLKHTARRALFAWVNGKVSIRANMAAAVAEVEVDENDLDDGGGDE